MSDVRVSRISFNTVASLVIVSAISFNPLAGTNDVRASQFSFNPLAGSNDVRVSQFSFNPLAAVSGGGVASGGGMIGTGMQRFYIPTDKSPPKALGYKRTYFDQSRATPQFREVPSAIGIIRPDTVTFDIAERASQELQGEIARLELVSTNLQELGNIVGFMKAQQEIKELQMQVEELDVMFMMMMLSTKLH